MQNGSKQYEFHVKTHAKYFPAIEIPVKNHANERIWPQDPEGRQNEEIIAPGRQRPPDDGKQRS